MNNFASLVEPLSAGFKQAQQNMDPNIKKAFEQILPFDQISKAMKPLTDMFGNGPLGQAFNNDPSTTAASPAQQPQQQQQAPVNQYADLQKQYANYAFTPVDHNPFGQVMSNISSGLYGNG